jgi:hypothetical protein
MIKVNAHRQPGSGIIDGPPTHTAVQISPDAVYILQTEADTLLCEVGANTSQITKQSVAFPEPIILIVWCIGNRDQWRPAKYEGENRLEKESIHPTCATTGCG